MNAAPEVPQQRVVVIRHGRWNWEARLAGVVRCISYSRHSALTGLVQFLASGAYKGRTIQAEV